MEFLKQIINNNGSENTSKYSIVDIYNKKKYFVTKYLDFLTGIGSDKFHLAEIPLFPSPVIVDVDIKEPGNDLKPLYNLSVVYDIILTYVNVLNNNLVNVPDEYSVLLLEKDPRIVNINEKSYIKHGFHLHFISLSLSKSDLKRVFNLAHSECEYSDYLDDVSSKPWLLYGASKSPEDKPYLITKCFKVTKTEEIVEIPDFRSIFYGCKYNGIDISISNVNEMLKCIMSIRNSKNLSLQIPNKLVEDVELESNLDVFIPKRHMKISIEKVSIIVTSLSQERADDYKSWISVGLVLSSLAKKNKDDENHLKGLYHIFSEKSDKYDEHTVETKWNSFMKSNHTGCGVGVGTLIFMLKEDGVLTNLDEILIDNNVEKIPLNDYDIANMIKNYCTDHYITHTRESGCYILKDTVWRKLTGYECVFKSIIDEWFGIYRSRIQKQIDALNISPEDPNYESLVQMPKKNLSKLVKKIKNVPSKGNIVKAMFDSFYDDNFEELFSQKEDKIAFKNCVFDIKNWKIIDGEPEHYFSERIDHDLIMWDKVPQENKTFVLDFWKKIFVDDDLREYCMKNFARFLTGKNSFKQFQFWTGSGNNGKSVCINLMEKVFGKMTMKAPKALINGTVQKQGAANPELYRLKDARLAIFDELTSNDYLDPGQIKGLTGNDKLYCRELYQKGTEIKEIIPMFFPVLITNEVPVIKRPDDATWERIRLIRFESVFKSNVEEYLKNNPDADKTKVFRTDPLLQLKLQENAPYFLSYFVHILFQYKSFSDFNEEEIIPDKVIEGLKKFKENQNIIKQFIEENYIVDENSSDIISTTKLLKEYSLSKPKIILSLQELESALEMYKNSIGGKGLKISGGKIKGLTKVL